MCMVDIKYASVGADVCVSIFVCDYYYYIWLVRNIIIRVFLFIVVVAVVWLELIGFVARTCLPIPMSACKSLFY